MSSKKSTQTRIRNAACVVYPDSAPENWVQILRNLHINVFISPLHDKDINPDGNEPKKPHYHVLLMFEGVKSPDQINEIFSSIGGVGFEVVSSLRGYARYLCHLDNPEKFQYSPDDVISIGFEVYQDVIGLPSDKYRVCSEILEWCSDNGVMYFSDLVLFAAAYRPDWFRALADNCTVFISAYFRSQNAKMSALARDPGNYTRANFSCADLSGQNLVGDDDAFSN